MRAPKPSGGVFDNRPRLAGDGAEPYRCRCGESAGQPGSLRTLSTIDSDVYFRSTPG